MKKVTFSIYSEVWALNKLDRLAEALNKASPGDWNRSTTFEYLLRNLNEVEYLEFVTKSKAAEFYALKDLLDRAREAAEEGKLMPPVEVVTK